MSSGDHGAVKVEPCIYRRNNGRYAVRVRLSNTTEPRQTFDTLKEARKYRDEMRAARPKPQRKRTEAISGKANFHRTGYVPEDTLTHKNTLRSFIAEAPRSTVYRDGREFTLVALPEVLT